MKVVGCDIGSLFSKAVVLDGDDLVASKVVRTTGNIADETDYLVNAVLRDAGMDRVKVDCLVGTGNGADMVKGADLVEDLITCAAAAAAFYLPEVQLSIDMGGQSITSMLLNEDGEVVNFMRNDKCASGSGRFIEVMSEKLSVDIADIDAAVARSTKVVQISAQCGVFAESEVISYVNAGDRVSDILAGVCSSVANMVVAQGRRFREAEHYTLTGGVARIDAVNRIISEKLSGTFHRFPQDPQLAAAIGAAVLGGT